MALIAFTIHFLRNGLPLCRFSSLVPASWPDGHKWIGLKDARPPAKGNAVLCAQCIGVRNAEIYQRRRTGGPGATLTAIASEYGMSPERVHQICKREAMRATV